MIIHTLLLFVFIFRLPENMRASLAFEDLLRLTDYCCPRGQNHVFVVIDQQILCLATICATTTLSNIGDWGEFVLVRQIPKTIVDLYMECPTHLLGNMYRSVV
jgi:hypothetical protein